MADPHKWEFRPPPSGEDLVLCPEGEARCRLAHLCPAAHSQRELQEWKKRKEIELKKQLDKASYSDRILKEVLSEKSTLPSTTESMIGVKLVSDQIECIKLSNRNSSTVWNFFLSSSLFLKGISLLHVENLQHFSLSEVSRVRNGNITELSYNKRECAIEDDEEETVEKSVNYHYRLKLKFTTKVFGVFSQTILFDFGTKPLLAKTVNVFVAPESAEDELKSTKESILVSSAVWSEATCNLIKFHPPQPKAQMDEDVLVKQYPVPNPQNFEITQACLDHGLTLENYRTRQHQLLYMEEIAQYQEITGFNTLLSLHVTERYLLSASPSNVSTAKYARPGELFGRIELNAELSDDSKAGKLILTKCSSILVKIDPDTPVAGEKKRGKKKQEKKKKAQQSSAKVWECLMEDTAKSVIYVRLPAALVLEQSLVSDQRLKAEVQFKLSRLSLVEMHYAIDKLSDLRVVYPLISSPPAIPWSPSHQWKENLDPLLNLKQKEAVLAITSPLNNPLPPILIIGPYGTGKTFTLGKALEMLLKESSNRILICTHSNSAADLYIKDYVDPAITKGNINKKVLRIYYYNRWVQTVHPTVQKYCLVETEEITQTRRFKIPQTKDLVEPDLVVATLSTSRCLAQQLPVGHFTHILLDEAAQALETESIMPLILADAKTRVVLAGDHMQLEPEVVSPYALEKRLNLSLLERLYDHYPANHPCKILLCENYRSHDEIVSFTSDLFYEQKLVSSGKQPPHPSWFPLTFFTARGQEVQDVNSTSYYNNYEVGEIVDRLVELRKNWPKSWGRKEDTEIGVVSPYHDQVMRIRAELRKKRLHNISVERVQNVQGKQYRAIFISTVRSRESCIHQNNKDFGFLSSAKLLNTAVTRAESLVAVVGDPVALCSVGRCRKLWERFVEICSKNNSLFGYTWKELQSNLQAIELNTIYGLNPMAKEFVPRVAMLYNLERPKLAALAATAGPTPPASGGPLMPPPPTSMVPPPRSPTALNMRLPPWLPMRGIPPLNGRIGSFGNIPMVPPHLAGYPLLSRPPLYQPLGRPASSTAAAGAGLPTSMHQGLLPPPPFLPPSVLSQLRPPILPPGIGPPSSQHAAATSQTPQMQQNMQVELAKLSYTKPPSATATAYDSAATVAAYGGVRPSSSAMDRILPPGTDLETILQSRSAQESWYSFLRSIGKETEAHAFEELIITEGGASLNPALRPPDTGSTANTAQPSRRLGTEAETAVLPEEEEKDGMKSMFDALMADFDKHDTNTPLYLRRSQPEAEAVGEMSNLTSQHQYPQQSVDYDGLEELTANALRNLHLHQQLMLSQYSGTANNQDKYPSASYANSSSHQDPLRTLDSSHQDPLGTFNSVTHTNGQGHAGLRVDEVGLTGQNKAAAPDDDLFSQQYLTRGLEELLGLQPSGGDNLNTYGAGTPHRYGLDDRRLSSDADSPPPLAYWDHKDPRCSAYEDLLDQPVSAGHPADEASQYTARLGGGEHVTARSTPPTLSGYELSGGGGGRSQENALPSSNAAETSGLPTYARVVMTSPRGEQEEDTLTKIRNLGTYGFQNLG